MVQPTQVPQPVVQKSKVQRRRKNAANFEQQSLPGQPVLSPSSIPPRQYIHNMTPMQNMAAISQNPLVSQMRTPGRGPQMQQHILLGKHGSNDMSLVRHPSLPPNVHDPYHQQQQWFQQQQQFRVPNSYPPQHHIYSAQQRPPMNPVIPQQTYYSQQQQMRQDVRNPMYYQPHQMYEQVPRYPPALTPQLGHSQQYYPEQGQNFYPSPNQMIQQPSHSQAMTVHQQVPSGPDDWQQHNANSQQRYSSQLQYPPPTSIQIEMQQVVFHYVRWLLFDIGLTNK